jgi:hypothetical protein
MRILLLYQGCYHSERSTERSLGDVGARGSRFDGPIRSQNPLVPVEGRGRFSALTIRPIPRPHLFFSVSGCTPVVLRNRPQDHTYRGVPNDDSGNTSDCTGRRNRPLHSFRRVLFNTVREHPEYLAIRVHASRISTSNDRPRKKSHPEKDQKSSLHTNTNGRHFRYGQAVQDADPNLSGVAHVRASRSQVAVVTPRSRSRNFCTLPFSVIGSAITNSMKRGMAKAGMRPRQ